MTRQRAVWLTIKLLMKEFSMNMLGLENISIGEIFTIIGTVVVVGTALVRVGFYFVRRRRSGKRGGQRRSVSSRKLTADARKAMNTMTREVREKPMEGDGRESVGYQGERVRRFRQKRRR